MKRGGSEGGEQAFITGADLVLNIKTTSLLLVLGMVAAGVGLLARGYMVVSRLVEAKADEPNKKDS